MSNDPLDLAIKEINETRCLVASLILSSESFDYPKAKAALKDLDKKLRQLAKQQKALESRRTGAQAPNVQHVNFGGSGNPQAPLSQKDSL